MSSVIKEASEQLEETPCSTNAVRILWISCLHGDWSFVFEGFLQRLYGRADVLAFRQGPSAPELVGDRHWYYYGGADFLRYPIIDAAVLAKHDGAQVLVNEFGQRVDLFRETRLYREMNALGALIDPTLECRNHGALAIRQPGLRSPSEKWQYIRDTYGLLISVARGSQFTSLLEFSLSSADADETTTGPRGSTTR